MGLGTAFLVRLLRQDVVDKIAKVSTGSANGHQDVPNEHIIIEEASA